jgi:alkanesulfonate monooxygenase SsuD/methylene tetrahydromethanopterin reductase-like flavin-dependent oxidoreductase (luciferase family)
MEIATLAELYPGRLTVGVGDGIPAWLDQAGSRPSSTLTLLDEYVHVLRRLVFAEPVTPEYLAFAQSWRAGSGGVRSGFRGRTARLL